MAHTRLASSPPPLPPTPVLVLALAAVLDLLFALLLALIFESLSIISMQVSRPAPPHPVHHLPFLSVAISVAIIFVVVVVVDVVVVVGSVAVKRPPFVLFLIHVWNGSVDGTFMRARIQNLITAETTMRRQKNWSTGNTAVTVHAGSHGTTVLWCTWGVPQKNFSGIHNGLEG